MNAQTVPTWIYRSRRHAEMYLFLARNNDFDVVPAPLRQRFGAPELVMTLDLDPARKLARSDTAQVLAGLREQGYFLQLPPDWNPALYFGD